MTTQREMSSYLEHNRGYLTHKEVEWIHAMIKTERLIEAKVTIDRLVSERKSYSDSRGVAV